MTATPLASQRRPSAATSPATHYPLLGHDSLRAIIAHYAQTPITAQHFLDQAAALAAQLPARRYAINLCGNPYLFMLGFAATLLRAQTSLLPPTQLAATIIALAERHPDSYLLCDATLEATLADSGLPQQRVSCAAQPASVSVMPMIAAEQVAAVLFTSGSTGQSIAHAKTWRTLVLGAAANARAYLRTGASSTLLGTIPTQHSYGLETLIMLPLRGHCAMCGTRPFFPRDIQHALQAMPAPRVLITTPVHLRVLLEARLPLAPLAELWSATAPLSQELAQRAEHAWQAPVSEIFGCTEAGSIATRRTTRDTDWQLHEEFSLRTDAAVGASDGATIHAAHLGDSPRLQDQIELLDERRFRVLGRGADLINIAGKRASLGDLNGKLLSIAGVQDGVIFLPEEPAANRKSVTRTAALVVAPSLTPASVLAALHEKIDRAFLPRPLFMVQALPRNGVSKLPRAELLKLFAELCHARQ